MSKFYKNKEITINIDSDINIKPEHKKMLNNLLGIASRDNTIFVRKNRTNNFDLSKIISKESLGKVFLQDTFSVNIIENHKEIINDLASAENLDDFLDIVDFESLNLSMVDRNLLEKDFEKNKGDIITKIKKEKDKRIAKWKRFRISYLDKKIQTNSWPLYVATMFIKVKIPGKSKSIYAPLIMKKVEVNISKSNVISLKSIDDAVDINEKLLFILQNEYQFSLPKMKADETFSLKEVIDEYTNALSSILDPNFNFIAPFEYKTQKDVNNQNLQFAPGITLSILSPSGGRLRDKLIDILKNDEIDEILDVDMKNIKREVEKDIKDGAAIYRITPTDLSQEKAIIGSFKDSAIIWGPPGTGKSQTIANIIANILNNEQTAIITSEKKAALDVIKKRMGKLSKYIFFGLTDKNINKAEFYEPFQDLMMKIDEVDGDWMYGDNDKGGIQEPRTILSQSEWNYFNQKEKLKDENIKNLIFIYKNYYSNNLISFPLIKGIYKNILNNKKLIKWLEEGYTFNETLLKENISKRGFIFKKYPKDIRYLEKYIKILNNPIKLFINLSYIKNIDNLNEITNYLKNENKYATSKNIFKSDEDYLDYLLAEKFLEKMKSFKDDPEKWKKVKSFKKSSQSAWRMPHKFINIYKDLIKELFDIFVSTPQTLSSIINMNSKFDFAIFDEASQLHIEKAIPFIAMADKSIIAGDHQQMRPTSYFAIRDESKIEAEDDVDSLLDFAERKGLRGTREYMLTKNYRSKCSELMLFSSKTFYEGNLDVIDNIEQNNTKPIEVIDVGGKWESNRNEKEAIQLLDRLLLETKNYKKIILLTLNVKQKQYIETLIFNTKKYHKLIELMENEKIYLRNLENIQGDEADLVITSVAYDKNARLHATYVGRKLGKNALNVAISRAIEKMIIFKSINSEDIKIGKNSESLKVFKEWLSYLELNSDERKDYIIKGNKESEIFDSDFEEDVYDFLYDNLKTKKELLITTQYKVGSYSIDIAIIDSKKNKFLLGIEVDGYRYHSGFKKMSEDWERQCFLEAKGYPIFRITELNWEFSKKNQLNKIKQFLS